MALSHIPIDEIRMIFAFVVGGIDFYDRLPRLLKIITVGELMVEGEIFYRDSVLDGDRMLILGIGADFGYLDCPI